MRTELPIAAEVRSVENLDAIAKRVRSREKKNRSERLNHVKKQAADVLAARKLARHGEWIPWCDKAGLDQRQARRYVEFGKSVVTSDFQSLAEEEQWAEWQRIEGNAGDPGEDGSEKSTVARESQAEEGGGAEERWRDENDCEPETSSECTVADGIEEPDPDYITLDAWNALTERQRRRVISEADGDKKFNSQGDNENISWALWSWNPVTGCLHNCPYCYARDIATTGPTARAFPNGFAPTLIPSRLKAPRNTTFPEEKARQWMGHRNVFVCSMADLFGRWVPKEWIEAVLDEVRAAPQWNFLFLTKFPIRMAEFVFPDNAWVGTTVDCQARVANAEKAFRQVKAGVKWLSIEPMLEPLTFSDLGAFQWIVIGGASRSAQTPEWHPPRAWVNAIEKEAKRLGVYLYEKSNLHFLIREYPGGPSHVVPKEAPPEIVYLPRDKA